MIKKIKLLYENRDIYTFEGINYEKKKVVIAYDMYSNKLISYFFEDNYEDIGVELSEITIKKLKSLKRTYCEKFFKSLGKSLNKSYKRYEKYKKIVLKEFFNTGLLPNEMEGRRILDEFRRSLDMSSTEFHRKIKEGYFKMKIVNDEKDIYEDYKDLTVGTDKDSNYFFIGQSTNPTKSKYDNVVGFLRYPYNNSDK